ncbi:hypothetical protein LCGC14_1796090 [marine sediment metagenome]|uniref:PKD domain-containing protein n=1 Tax=marine sediment metagenome TaxID=412755 RepID=A0A0F9GR35_9ZZZZ
MWNIPVPSEQPTPQSISRNAAGQIRVYKNNTTSYVIEGITDIEDFDSVIGIHSLAIDTSDSNFYTIGDNYTAILVESVVGVQVLVGFTLGTLPPPPTADIFASRTSGMVPFAVFFEGTDSTDSLGRSIGDSSGSGNGLLGNDITEYFWDFGAGSEGDVGGRYFDGFNAAHAYETAGNYTVRLTVREGSRVSSTISTITAQAFAGTTYYVRADGNNANSGAGPTAGDAWQTYEYAMAAIDRKTTVQPGDRVLFNRGDTFPLPARVIINFVDDVLVAAYGTGERPLIQHTGSSTDGSPLEAYHTDGLAMADIRFDLESSTGSRFSAFGGTNLSNFLVLRTTFDRYRGLAFYGNGLFIADSTLSDAVTVNLYFNGSRLALLNNDIGPAQTSHNLYGSHIDRGVITGTHFHDVVNARSGIRIAANGAPGSWNVVVSDNVLNNIPVPIDLKVTEPGSPYSAHNIIIERNHFTSVGFGSAISNQRDGYTDIIIRNNLFEGQALWLRDLANPGGANTGIDGLRFYNNTIRCVDKAMRIEISDHTDLRFFNNIIEITDSSGASRAITISGGIGEITFNYNLYYAPNRGASPIIFTVVASSYTFAQWQSTFSQDANGLEDDPLFDSGGTTGFELLANSPAINQGTILSLVLGDYTHIHSPSAPPFPWRPQGLTHDIGIFEVEE